jgi:hypothetical protein
MVLQWPRHHREEDEANENSVVNRHGTQESQNFAAPKSMEANY